MKKILVYRFSGMGDMVFILPVLKGLLDSNQQLEIYLLSRPVFFPIFKGIDRLHLVEAELKGRHRGFRGMVRLYRQLRREVQPDEVFDLHQVLRSRVLNLLFRLGGTRIFRFNPGTAEKKQAVRSKSYQQLPSVVDHYAAIFSHAGYRFVLPLPDFWGQTSKHEALGRLGINSDGIDKVIGIAPFARYRQQEWGIDRVGDLIALLVRVPRVSVVLFGRGSKQVQDLEQLVSLFAGAVVSAHQIPFEQELALLPHLDILVSMDSANMHLGAMAGIPVVSVWGATHPALGFAPYHQPVENLIQYNGVELDCRPCSVLGNKKCIYRDIRCMNYVSVGQVAERIGFLLDHPIHHYLPLHSRHDSAMSD